MTRIPSRRDVLKAGSTIALGSALGVERAGEAGDAGADDHEVGAAGLHHRLPSAADGEHGVDRAAGAGSDLGRDLDAGLEGL